MQKSNIKIENYKPKFKNKFKKQKNNKLHKSHKYFLVLGGRARHDFAFLFVILLFNF
jgi:hypothetical protein